METNQQIRKQQQQVTKLERKLAQQKLKARKADTRRKIEFGGLVIKSSMSKFSKAVILGVLIDAFETLNKDKEAERLFRLKGESAFMGHIE